jgi:hypothetical protein
VKILSSVLTVLLTILITGCSTEPQIEVRYVDRVVEKVVQVPCQLEQVKCVIDMNATYTGKVTVFGECIEDLIKLQEMHK